MHVMSRIQRLQLEVQTWADAHRECTCPDRQGYVRLAVVCCVQCGVDLKVMQLCAQGRTRESCVIGGQTGKPTEAQMAFA